MRAEFKITTRNRFAQVANASVEDLKAGVYMVAEEIMTDSKRNYVPIGVGTPSPGNLMRSGFVNRPVLKGTVVTVTLGYGGAAAPYAAAVHEAPPSWGQGKNKYLSRPLQAAIPTLANRLAAFISARQKAMKRTIV